MRIEKALIPYNQDTFTHALVFHPSKESYEGKQAIFCHGYTADKGSILNWGIRLQEVGIKVILFDLPGHYLGNFSEVLDFEYFKENAHKLFYEAYKILNKDSQAEASSTALILGGHSLGALLALKAMELEAFSNIKKVGIGVGIGMAPKKGLHLFDTPFYKQTLLLRNQLISSALHSDNVFPWIKDEKEKIAIKNQKIHLITGIDDLVVGNDGMERFRDKLIENSNDVSFEKPSRLPHHEPNLAAVHIKKYLKDKF